MTLRSTLLSLDQRTGGLLRRAYASSAPRFFRAAGALVPGSRARRYCPCCDAGLIAWKKASFSRRPDLYDARRYAGMPQDVVCPACGSIPRHRIIAWHLGQRPELLRGKKVLHFAPERRLSLWSARRRLDVTTADLHRATDLKLDLTDIDLPDGSYDAAICNHVLEHVGDYRRALSELHRILRPGGLLIISFPIDPRYETVREDASVVEPQDRVGHFGQHDHLRVCGTDSADILENAGFGVEIARGAACERGWSAQ